jgi:hypothetical protein
MDEKVPLRVQAGEILSVLLLALLLDLGFSHIVETLSGPIR